MAGVPIGPNDFVADFLTSAHTESLKLSEAINTVKTAGFLQQGFLLDYYCLRPRVNPLLRCLPPRLTSDLASQHDSLMLSALSEGVGDHSAVGYLLLRFAHCAVGLSL